MSDAGTKTAVILVAHGTRSPAGAATTQAVVRRMAAAHPDVDVSAAFVDVQEPRVGDAVAARAVEYERVVVMPLLFCGGYHVQVDVANAIAPHENAVSTGPLAPAVELAQLLAENLAASGVEKSNPIVLAVAGSSRPEANASARAQAKLLAEVWGAPVDVAFGAAGTPRVADAVMANRDRPGARVAVASLLIGEGHFYDRLSSSGADVVTEPLRDAEQLIALLSRKLGEVR